MNFFNRLQGVFFNPQATFKALAGKPVWVDTLIVILIAFTLFTYFSAPYSRSDQIDIFKNNVELKERMGEDAFNERLELIENPPQWQAILGYVSAPVTLMIGLLVASLFLLLFGRMGSTEGKYGQVLSAYLHANLIDKLLGNGVRLFLILTRKSTFQATTSMAMLFPKMEVTSTAFAVLSQIDFFQIWMFGVLAFGLAEVFKIPLRRALIVSYLIWAIKSLLYIGLMLLSMQIMG
ncbi:MAG: hypothetical protein GQ544_04605 [Candidatus Aminicenantes bacterium]|nr:hypothetical protein [Candidatus Aminicenantes bacterium]